MTTATKLINDISAVTDLADGERAYPDAGIVHYVRRLGSADRETTEPVTWVERFGDDLFAVTADGCRYSVTSDFALTGLAKRTALTDEERNLLAAFERGAWVPSYYGNWFQVARQRKDKTQETRPMRYTSLEGAIAECERLNKRNRR